MNNYRTVRTILTRRDFLSLCPLERKQRKSKASSRKRFSKLVSIGTQAKSTQALIRKSKASQHETKFHVEECFAFFGMFQRLFVSRKSATCM